MRFSDTIRIAMSNLWKRKLRTTLTIFAVVIGATLIALMVSLGVGLQNYVTGQLTALSVPDIISVEPKTNLGVASILIGASGLGAPQEVEEGQPFSYLNIESLSGEDLRRVASDHLTGVHSAVVSHRLDQKPAKRAGKIGSSLGRNLEPVSVELFQPTRRFNTEQTGGISEHMATKPGRLVRHRVHKNA